MARSVSDHFCIRCAAVTEYGVEGRGVLKDGGGGSCGKSSGGICGLVAQAVRDSAQAIKLTAQLRLTVSGVIHGSLILCGDGLLGLAYTGVGRALSHAHFGLVGLGGQPGLGQVSAEAGLLEEPDRRPDQDSCGDMGVERERIHGAAPATVSAQRERGTLPMR